VYQLLVFVHILAAVVWIGGVVFIPLVLMPATRGMPQRAEVITAAGRRFRVVGWAALALGVATGLAIAYLRGVPRLLLTGELWESSWGRLFVAKVLLVGAMIALSLAHDLLLVAAGRTMRRKDASGEAVDRAARYRRLSSIAAQAMGLVALAVLAVAVLLVRGLP